MYKSLEHTWEIIENGGYFIIAGDFSKGKYPGNSPADVYNIAVKLGFNISEVHVIGENIGEAKAIILKKPNYSAKISDFIQVLANPTKTQL